MHGKIRGKGMSQGDYNAAGTMMEVVIDIFKDIVYQCLVIYINDITSYTRSYEEHIRDL